MTREQRIARIPTDRHVYYEPRWRGDTLTFMARWLDDAGHRRGVAVGYRLPPGLPDYPCQHPRTFPWCKPTTEAEKQAIIERGRRGNALRKKRSNKWLKLREMAEQNIA